jgi:hypothetical protein
LLEGLNEGGRTIEGSNIGVTTKVENFKNFDLTTNGSPIIVMVVLTVVYFLGVAFLRKKDRIVKTTEQSIRE